MGRAERECELILRFAKSLLLAALAALNSYAIMTSKKAVESPLPYSAEAERTELGAIVLNPDAALIALPLLRAEYFFLESNRRIYRAIEQLTASGKPIDLVMLTETLNARGELEAAGGPSYLASLLDGLPRGTNVAHYAGIIIEKYRLRALIEACESIEAEALAKGDSGAIIESAVEKILSLAGDGQGEAKIIEWQEAAKSAVDEIEAAKREPKSLCMLNFGLRKLDNLTGGLRKKETTLIVAPTSNGKSLIAEQLCVTADDDGHKGMIFSAEMSAEAIAMRQLSYEADVFLYHTRQPDKLSEEQIDKLRFAARKERNIAIVDSGITPARVWALAEARKRSSGLDYCVVDYDQLVIEAGIDPNADERIFFQHQTDFIHRAVRFGKRLDLAMIILCQIRKTPPGVKQGAKPTVDDIYGSSAMRNDPDVIIWILRDYFLKGMNKEYERKAKGHVVKSRNGKTGIVALEFDPKRVRFLNASSAEDAETEE
jgi:replicative DNA helicase